MFRFNSIQLLNFRSYAGAHTFTFPTISGLYNLTGQNLDNPRLGANGAGKSTLLEAIYWCLYGRTTRGLKAADVISWGHKTCAISLELTVGNATATLTRKQSPNSLELDNKPVDQDAVQKFVRLTPDAFTHSIMMDQFGEAFFDLPPSAKLTLFSSIMELDSWLERSKAAADLAKELSEDKNNQERVLADCEGQHKVIEADLLALKELSANFEHKQQQALQKLKSELIIAKKAETKLKLTLETAQQALAGAEARLTRSEGLITKTQTRIEALQGQLQAAVVTVAIAQTALNALRASLSGLTGLGATCPTCLQKVTSGHLKAEQGRLKTCEADARNQLEAAEEALRVVDDTINIQRKALSNDKKDRESIRGNRNDFEAEVSARTSQLSSLQQHLALHANPPQIQNPYQSQIKGKESALQKLTQKEIGLKAEINQIAQDHIAVSYWINGFKKIRLFIIDQTLQTLELEVNNNLAALGLLDWRVAFDVERENKSGGITKGFTVLVYAPGHIAPIKFEAWSGGETQRLRLAGDLGLANLIMQRAGLISSVELFDEPSQHLSNEGLLDLAEALHERAITSNKVIFLVDHRLLDFGDFSGRFVAVKDKTGSRLETTP